MVGGVGRAGNRKENRRANGGARKIGHFPGAAGADHWMAVGFAWGLRNNNENNILRTAGNW